MAARQKGSFSLGGTLEILADAPADARLCVKTKSELTDANSYPYKYVGMIVSVADEGKAYILTAADTTIASNWKELGEGGGGGGGTAGSVYTGTLLASGWNSTTKQQTLTFTSYDASYHGVIGLPADATAAQMEEYRNCLIRTVSQSGATVTFKCEEIPTINLPVEIYCGGGSGSAEFPSGGTTGQALVKKSNADNDVEWGTINSIPDGGTEGQVLAKHSATDKDVEWVDQIDTQKEIKNNGTAVTDRDTINFTDFDISDDSTNEETDIKPHKITSGEWADIISTLPGTPVQTRIYSPVEHVIGEWHEEVDGVLKKKPLYEKTMTTTISAVQTISAMTPSSDAFIKNFDVKCYYNGEMTVPNAFSNDNWGVTVWVASNNKDLGCRANKAEYVGQNVRAIIQYVKTTDSWETV